MYEGHRWNQDKITLYLFVPKSYQNCEYYIIGNIPELGNKSKYNLGSWKSTKQLQNINIDKQISKTIYMHKSDFEKSQV